MKSIVGILCWGTVENDGKSYTMDAGLTTIPLAEGFDPRPAGSHERFWQGEKIVGYLWWKKTTRVAVPFEIVGYAPIGQ